MKAALTPTYIQLPPTGIAPKQSGTLLDLTKKRHEDFIKKFKGWLQTGKRG